MTEPNGQVWVWWSPGEPEDDLHGFVSREERDAAGCGEPGPFRRIVRNHHKLGPVSDEVQLVRRYLDAGRLKQGPQEPQEK